MDTVDNGNWKSSKNFERYLDLIRESWECTLAIKKCALKYK